jgi:LAO/AO transport system kinase
MADATPNVDALADNIRAGDWRALARAITLVESTRADHREQATALLEMLLPSTGGATRVGISGAPGAGKSTFIEALGVSLCEHEHRVAVLAVDPSSTRSGGSILGDKTRMAELSRHPRAFIRPSPTGGTLGGVARRTREAMLLCEAAGFDVVLVETVGVGQSEVAVAGMVDTFLLLLSPAGGDELQGVKRGIVELADIIVVNKADGDLEAAARRTASDYASAIHFVGGRGGWMPPVLVCSALTGTGIEAVWKAIGEHQAATTAGGERERRRAVQAREWMWSEVTDTLLERLRRDGEVGALIAPLERDVEAGRISASAAAHRILAALAER